jgi:hypothetical protein
MLNSSFKLLAFCGMKDPKLLRLIVVPSFPCQTGNSRFWVGSFDQAPRTRRLAREPNCIVLISREKINQETRGSQLASIMHLMRVYLLLRAASEGTINGSGNSMSTRNQKQLSTQPSLGITVRLGEPDW